METHVSPCAKSVPRKTDRRFSFLSLLPLGTRRGFPSRSRILGRWNLWPHIVIELEAYVGPRVDFVPRETDRRFLHSYPCCRQVGVEGFHHDQGGVARALRYRRRSSPSSPPPRPVLLHHGSELCQAGRCLGHVAHDRVNEGRPV